MVYVRPDGAYDGQQITNRRKYQNDSVAVPRVAISSAKVDGDINYLIDATNELEQAISDITLGGLPDGSVTTAKLADNAVDTVKVANDAITTDKILDGNISTAKLADNAVNNAKLGTEAVNTINMLDGAVTTAKLANGSVTQEKLNSSIVFTGSDYINDTTTVVGTNQVTWLGSCQNEENNELLESATAITGTLGSPAASTNYEVWVGYDAEDELKVEIIDADTGVLSIITGKKRLVRTVRTDGDSHLKADTLKVEYQNPNISALAKQAEVILWEGDLEDGSVTLSENLSNFTKFYVQGTFSDNTGNRNWQGEANTNIYDLGTICAMSAGTATTSIQWYLTKVSETELDVVGQNARAKRIVGVR